MKAWAPTWDAGVRKLMVATCANIEDAKVAVESARSDAGAAVAAEADLDISGPQLACLYNKLLDLAVEGDNSEGHVARFATKGDGQRRVFGLLEAHFKNAPEAAAPPTVDTDAAKPETETNEDDIATKGKKTTKKKVAPAAKKAKTAKKGGAKAAVREETYMGRILKYGVEGTKSLAQLVVLSKIADNGRNSKSRAKFRAKKVAALVGGSFSIDEKEVATTKLPAGSSLDKIFGR